MNQSQEYINSGEPRKGLKVAHKAYLLAQSENSQLLADACFRYANAFNASGDFDNASTYFEKAMERANLDGNSELLIKILLSYGIMRVRAGEYENGERNIYKGIEAAQETNNRLLQGIGFQYLGVSKKNQNENLDAIDFYKMSIALFSELGNKTIVAENYNNVAQAFAHIEKFDSAEVYMGKAIAIGKTLRGSRYVNEFYTNLALIHIQEGSNHKTLKAQIEHFATLYDSNQTLLSQFIEPQKYINESILELSQKQASEIQSLAKEVEVGNKRMRALILALSVLVLIIISGAAFILYNRRTKQRSIHKPEKTLEQQRIEALLIYNERMSILLTAKNELLPTCYELLTRNYNLTEISAIIGKTTGTMTRYSDEICELLGLNKDQMKIEARNLGAIIWAKDKSHS